MFALLYQARREPEFSIGWSNNNQMNDYQLRKSKNKEVTGKITTQSIIQGQDVSYPQRQQQQLQAYDPTPKDCIFHAIKINAFSMKIQTCLKKNWKKWCFNMTNIVEPPPEAPKKKTGLARLVMLIEDNRSSPEKAWRILSTTELEQANKAIKRGHEYIIWYEA